MPLSSEHWEVRHGNDEWFARRTPHTLDVSAREARMSLTDGWCHVQQGIGQCSRQGPVAFIAGIINQCWKHSSIVRRICDINQRIGRRTQFAQFGLNAQAFHFVHFKYCLLEIFAELRSIVLISSVERHQTCLVRARLTDKTKTELII